MQKIIKEHYKSNSESGAALILVLAILMTLTLLAFGVITSTATNVSLARNYEVATQAQNMADTGIRVCYREMINVGFIRTTHTEDLADPATGDELLTTTLENYYIDADGYFVWEWDESQAYDPMWNTTTEHGYRFRAYYTTQYEFVIEAEGWYGPITRRTRAKGQVENMFQFSYFASRDMGEFVRGASQEIRGKVHANGIMYIRPSGSTLRVNTDSFTSTGSMVRTRDAWGRPDTSGACEITKNSQDSGTWVAMDPGSPRGSEGIAFDSAHADWTDKTLGARETWGGVVRDFVPYKSPPPIQNLDPDEYYYDLANSNGTLVDNTTHSKGWCDRVTNMYNYNEERYQTIWDIDVAALIAAGDWPTNGLLYCEVPVRLSNATTLQAKLMVASCRNVYTKGDFNTVNKKGAAIMTMQRIYHLSDNWDDASYVPALSTTSRTALTTTINGALVDGAPTVDEYNWCDRDGDNDYDYNGTKIYDPEIPKTAAGFNNPYSSSNPWANCDDLLENWNGTTLTKFGSVVHLGETYDNMTANLDNSGIGDDEIAWVRKTGYKPPTRNYLYDPDLADPTTQPPFTPLIGHIRSWEPY